jgi:dipeptidyl-peptidase-4
MTDSFPRQYAATRRFSLGVPRAFQISPDGSRVMFLRSRGGTDPITCLWVLDLHAGAAAAAERLAADPLTLGVTGDLPPQERARRERIREQAGGIVSYVCDARASIAVFALAGHVYVAGLTAAGPSVREVPTMTPAVDPRPDPTGRRVAYVSGGALRVADLPDPRPAGPAGPAEPAEPADGGAGDLVLATPEHGQVTYGLAEFAAAEEMGRHRGFWWAPDGSSLLVARVDESAVQRWHIGDPANPDRPPVEMAYPAAGTANADVSLVLVGLDGRHTALDWDQVVYPYLASVCWDGGPAADGPLLLVQDRSQRQARILRADPATGRCELVHAASDADWLDIMPGVPAWTAAGDLVWTCDSEGANRLLVAPPAELAAAAPVTPPDLQVRAVLDVAGDEVFFAASREPTQIELWTYGPGGLRQIGLEPGLHAGRRRAGVTVISSRFLDSVGGRVEVRRDGQAGPVASIASLAQRPNLATPDATPRVEIFAAGSRQIRTAVVYPSWHQRGSARLPVLMAPYGGPHYQEVVAAGGAYVVAQWLADQGFAVVIADGRGTPGRGTRWEKEIRGDFAGPVLDDQVAALHAAADRFGDLDLGRVGIRGWSFGGYLAALAVLRRPDVFHAAVAGAPVVDWRLYDTHYTERYLGHPDQEKDAYDGCSLLPDAARLSRPLLLIHGLADDNVVAAHTLRLSAALLAAGRPHSVLPLCGVTHMAAQEQVAENLLLLQVEFLHHALGPATHAAAAGAGGAGGTAEAGGAGGSTAPGGPAPGPASP